MEKEKLDHYKALLQALAAELEEGLAADPGASATVSLDDPIGRLSRAGALQSQKIAQALQANLEGRLKQTRAALARIENGSYGLCGACHQPIPEGRLAAMPEAPLCVKCSW
jgi:DnaK suppressor protein